MHESRGISCVMWKDKGPVLLISMHAIPIGYPYMPVDTVPRRHNTIREGIQTSPILVEYSIFMRGIDVVDQLHASYSSQTRSGGIEFSLLCWMLQKSTCISYTWHGATRIQI